eukprot:GFYU01009298.1.p1 GENE.GFYU01009298.1~~GFYU01009298.1.p1  ORF type:complete len:185 (+),score=20.22 GFYU01009298.1:46-600(+)
MLRTSLIHAQRLFAHPEMAPSVGAAFGSHTRGFKKAKKKTTVRLMEDIQGTGYIGEVLEVAPGFWRNHLQPKGLASRLSEAEISQRQATQKAELSEGSRLAASMRKRLSTANIHFKRHVEKGAEKPKGVVTVENIIDAVYKQIQMELPPDSITLLRPLQTIGDHKITVTLDDTPVYLSVSIQKR